jgi:hypothetical protein
MPVRARAVHLGPVVERMLPGLDVSPPCWQLQAFSALLWSILFDRGSVSRFRQTATLPTANMAA